MRFLIFQHIACEHPGVFRELLRDHGIGVHVVEFDRGDPTPDPAEFDALWVFGGPMSVNDADRFPWLRDELAAIRRAADHDTPYLGVCLGAQLLARALGAEVKKNPIPEIGILDVELTPEGTRDPLFAGFPARMTVLQWHGETFEIPVGGVWLARSEWCAHQAFRYGPRAYGLQYHVEVTPGMVAGWAGVEEYCASLREVTGSEDSRPLLEVTKAHAGDLRAKAVRLFDNFLRLVDPAP